jgi:hypothetical protein
MNKTLKVGAVLCLVAGVAITWALMVKHASAAAPEKFIHVRVKDPSKGEMVSVNFPLSVAEKVLPTIQKGNLHQGKVTIGSAELHDIDIRALLAAVAESPDNEFVTVKEKGQEVRVAKSKGNFIIHVVDSEESEKKDEKQAEKVDVIVPIAVVNALVPNDKQELDLMAAIHALSEAGDALLVTVHDGTQEVKVWVDSQNDGSK